MHFNQLSNCLYNFLQCWGFWCWHLAWRYQFCVWRLVSNTRSIGAALHHPAIGFLCASVGIKSTYVDCRNNPTNRPRNMPIIGLCVVNMIKEGERAYTMFMYTAFFWIKTCIVKKCVRTWMLSRCKQILMWGFFWGGGICMVTISNLVLLWKWCNLIG